MGGGVSGVSAGVAAGAVGGGGGEGVVEYSLPLAYWRIIIIWVCGGGGGGVGFGI